MKKYLLVISVLFFSISTVWTQSLTSEADSNRMMRQNIAQANSRNMLAKQAADEIVEGPVYISNLLIRF